MIPRISSAIRVALSLTSTDEGLTVYDTDTKTYWLWDGNKWRDFNTGPKHYVGEIFDEGIVFYVDETGASGLMASLWDLDGEDGVSWEPSTTDVDDCESVLYGNLNTASIMDTNPTSGAAYLCDAFSAGGNSDWYLPAIRELSLLLSHALLINTILDNDNDENTHGLYLYDATGTNTLFGRYWSSTETSDTRAMYYYDAQGYYTNTTKTQLYKVRAIRKF